MKSNLKNSLPTFKNLLYQRILAIRPVELALFLKFILRVNRIWLELDNLKFFIDPCTNWGQRLLTTKAYEPEMTKAIQDLLSPGDCFIDLGGNEGYFSIVAARHVGSAGRVFCIEPQARLWPVIINNISGNGISNCTVVPYGISDEFGFCDITLYPTINSGASSMVSSIRGNFYPKQTIELISLDYFISLFNIQRIQVMKIDIEGFELNALKSGAKALSRKIIKNLFIEIHPVQLKTLNQTPSELIEFLEGFGYKYTNQGELHIFSC